MIVDSILPYIFDLKKVVRVMLSRYNEQKEKNLSLAHQNRLMSEKMNVLEREVKELKKRVEIVDIAKGIAIKDDDSADFARGRVNNLIRQIDKCISLLNE